jgi:hypothetical protein
LFTAGEDDDLEHHSQEQEERCTMAFGFEFSQGLKSSATTLQGDRQGMKSMHHLATTLDPIDGPTQPPIRTPSRTTQSSKLALGEIQIRKPEESTWSDIATGNSPTPPTSI